MNDVIWPPLGVTARARVVEITDGDTLSVELSLPISVRIRNCWAAEKNTDAGKAAKEYIQQLLPPGSEVVVNVPTHHVKKVQSIFSFGRVLGNIYRQIDGKSIADIMISAGHAFSSKGELLGNDSS
jgi:endonuclease YncB( thermonuclease family)